MDTEHIYMGDYGVELVLDTNIDLSGATNSRIYYRKPDDTEGYWSADVSGQNIVYTLQTGDIDQTGIWRLHAYAELNGPVHGKTAKLRVLNKFVP